MRKIISILVAMGLMLSMAVVAAPAAAQTCTAIVTPDDPCAGHETCYNVTFTSPVTLLAGNDMLSFDFPEGTTFDTFGTGDITVDGSAVAPASIVVDGTHVEFLLPAGASIDAGDSVEVIICEVVNPAGGDYELALDYKLSCCDPVVFDCGEYTILPAFSTYKFLLNFAPTYPGLCADFIPPFQACGQNGTDKDFNTTYNSTMDAWFSGFNLTLTYDDLGCAPPCDDPEVYFELMSAPEDGVATMSVNGTWFSLDMSDPGTSNVGSLGTITLEEDSIIVWESFLHFDTVGDFELCFYAECPANTDPCDPEPSAIIAERCEVFNVYQWKEAVPIPLYRKWNLISLPVVPFNTDIEYILSAICPSEIVGVWYYDQCELDDYLAYPDFGLTTMEDGKAYWLKVAYTTATAGDFYANLWVWGTDRPGDPPTPVTYQVCEGWNMIGLTSLTPVDDDVYLSNWLNFFGVYGYGTIYGWDATIQKYDTQAVGAATLDPTEGYWIHFDWDGTIYF